MRRFVRSLLSGLGLVCAVAAVVMSSIFAVQTEAGAQTGSEQIVSYDVAIAIQRDTSILVTEQIVYDFGSHKRHGITRDIPVHYAYNDRYDRYFSVYVRSVQSPDAPARYTVDNTGDDVVIKIGDPNKTVAGVHTYRLTYLVRDSLIAFKDYDMLVLNAIGNQWNVPISRATVRVTAPAAPTYTACWAGPSDKDTPCQQSRIANGAAIFSQAGLGPHEGLALAVGIPEGVIAPPHPVLRERPSLQRDFALTPVSVGASGGLLAVLVILGALVWARGRIRRSTMSAPDVTGASPPPPKAAPPSGHGQHAMETAPPEDLRPGQAGVLLNGVARRRDITATIVDLAVRGYLRIEDPGREAESRDWRLIRLGKNGGLLDYEQILLHGLFINAMPDGGALSVRLPELGKEFAFQLEQAEDALCMDVTKRGWFATFPDVARRKWRTIGLAMFVTGVVAVIVAADVHLGLVPIPLALAGLVLICGAKWMQGRTTEGAAMARRVEGFRRCIKTAAVNRAHLVEQPDALYGYLPYAIALGCTKEWADLTGSLAHTSQAPSWYQTRAPFTAGSLASLSRASRYFSSVDHPALANKWAAMIESGTDGSVRYPEEEVDAVVSRITDTFNLHPSDVNTSRNYLDWLRTQGRFREALSVTRKLSAKLRCEPSIRAVLGALYRDMGCHAHAVDAYGNAHDLAKSSRKYRWNSKQKSCIIFGLYRQRWRDKERETGEIWEKWCEERAATLDTLDIPKNTELARSTIELERNLLSRAGLCVRRKRAARWAKVFISFLVILSMVGLMVLAVRLASIYPPYPPLVSLTPYAIFFLVPIVAILVAFLIGGPDVRASSVRRESRVRLAAWLSLPAFACSLLVYRRGTPWTWWSAVGAVLIYSALILWVGFGSVYGVDWTMRDLRRKSPCQVVLGDMLQLLGEINDPRKRNDMQARGRWMALLEDDAWTIERYLPTSLGDQDHVTRQWVTTTESQAAAAIRVMACRIAVPEQQDWDGLIADLRQDAKAVAISEYGALKRESSGSATGSSAKLSCRHLLS
jgi:hypothetical protein